MNSLPSLPEELLVEIFSLLDLTSILTVSEVCKNFFAIVNSQKFMKRVCVNLTRWEIFSDSERRYVKAFINNPDELTVDYLVKTLNLNPTPVETLKSMRFTNVNIFNYDSFASLTLAISHVSELEFEGVYLQNNQQSFQPSNVFFKNLKNLSFIYSSNRLLGLFTNIKNQIKTLKICLPPHEDDEDKMRNFQNVSRLLDNNKTTISKLHIYDTSFNDDFMAQIANINFACLKTFSMAFNSRLADDCRSFKTFLVRNYDKLETFKIRTFDHIGNEQLKVLLDNGDNLKKLNLIVCATCDYDRIACISNLKSLESLKIQSNIYCAYGSQSYERLIVDKVLGFRNLKIKSFRVELLNMNADVISKISSAFPNLKELNIITACVVKDDCLNLLRKNLKSLKTLKVNGKIK